MKKSFLLFFCVFSVIFPTAGAIGKTVKKPSPVLIKDMAVCSPIEGNAYLRVFFNGEVDMDGVEKRISFTPPVTVSSVRKELYSWNNTLRVDGEFKPGSTYEMTIHKGFLLKDKNALDYDIVRVVEFPDREISVIFAAPGRYLAPEGRSYVPFSLMNVRGLKVSVCRLLPQNVVQFVAREEGVYSGYCFDKTSGLVDAEKEQSFQIPWKRNELTRLDVPLDGLLSSPRGVFQIEASTKKNEANAKRVICVSDIGLSACVDAGAVHVWTTALSTGKPCAGMKVSVWALNQSLIGKTVSGADGVAVIPLPKGLEPFVVMAESEDGTDMSYLPLRDKMDTTEKVAGAKGHYLKDRECEAFLFFDRGIYRPGDTVFVQGLLRDKAARAPIPFPVKLDVRSRAGRVLFTRQLVPDVTGSFALTNGIPLPESIQTGTWRVTLSVPGGDEAVLGESSFFVESFVPRQIKVEVKGLPMETPYGVTNSIRIQGDYLFGKPCSWHKAEVRLSFSDAPFTPDGWKGWSFVHAGRSTNLKCKNSGNLLDDGAIEAELLFPETVLPSSMLKAVIEATVFEPGGRPVSARASTLIHVYPFYIGLKSEEKIFRPGVTFPVSAVSVLPNGVLRKGPCRARVTLSSVQQSYGYMRDDNGSYSWTRERRVRKISESQIVLDGLTKIPVTAKNDGSFLLTVSDMDSNVENTFAFDVTGSGNEGERTNLSNPSTVELTFDRKTYRSGETAKLLVKTPFLGTAELTLFRDGVLSQQVIRLTSAATTLSLPVKEEWYPNIFASVRVLNVSTNEIGWAAQRAKGTALLCVERPENHLDVTVAPQVTIVPGGSRLSAKMTVRSSTGAPLDNVRMTVTAVDESIHLLTDEPCPDPFGFFSRARVSKISMYDLFCEIMPVTPGPFAKTNIGGGDDEELMKRVSPVRSRRFKPLSLWQAEIPVKDGMADFEAILPEFAGEVRVTAVAWSATATGAAKANVKVTPKLVVMPDAPRFLAGGDSADMTLTLHNTTPADAEVSYAVTFTDVLSDSRSQSATFTLPKNTTKTLRLPFSARQSGYGEGKIVTEVKGCGEEHRQTLLMPVRPAVPITTAYEFTTLKAGDSKTFLLPAGVVTNAVRQKVLCHKSAYSEFLPALQYVLGYPYGCLEQTVSSVFPLLAADGFLMRMSHADNAQVQEAHEKVKDAITRVFSMQRENGFAPWPSCYEPDEDLSLYVGYFLAEASHVDEDLHNKSMLVATRSILRQIAENSELDVNRRAYACHALAVMRDFRKQLFLHLLDRQSELTAEGRYHLAIALSLSGRRDIAVALISRVQYAESVRAASFGILAWLELDTPEREEHIRKLYHQLISFRSSSGHWGDTQSNSLALLAIASLARRETVDNRPFSLRVQDATGKPLCTNTRDRSSFTADNKAFTAFNDGPGPVTLVRTLRMYPLLDDIGGEDNGLRITREYLEPSQGKTIDAKNLKLGDRLIVRLKISLKRKNTEMKDVVIDELLPACLEVDGTPADTCKDISWISWKSLFWILNIDVRDDRILFFSKEFSGKDKTELYYPVRVVSAGTFIVPPASAECMYHAEIRSRTKTSVMKVSE